MELYIVEHILAGAVLVIPLAVICVVGYASYLLAVIIPAGNLIIISIFFTGGFSLNRFSDFNKVLARWIMLSYFLIGLVVGGCLIPFLRIEKFGYKFDPFIAWSIPGSFLIGALAHEVYGWARKKFTEKVISLWKTFLPFW